MITLLLNDVAERLKKTHSYNNWMDALNKGRFPIEVEGVNGPFSSFLLVRLYQIKKAAYLVVLPDEAAAELYASDLKTLGADVYHFPWWGTMLYRGVSPQARIFGERAAILSRLASGEKGIYVTSLKAYTSLLPPPEYICNKQFTFRKNARINVDEVEQRLEAFGYLRVPRVSLHGEFAVRGEVLDFYPPDSSWAVRIVFDFDEIEEIREFDPQIQSSIGKLDSAIIRPSREVLWEEERLDVLKRQIDGAREFKEGFEAFEELSETRQMRGEELFYPLAFDRPVSLGDYLGSADTTFFIHTESLKNTASALETEMNELYREALRNRLLVPRPERLFRPWEECLQEVKRKVVFPQLRSDVHLDGACRIVFSSSGARSYFGNINLLKEELGNLQASGYRTFICCGSDSQASRMQYMLKDFPVEVLPETLSSGFSSADLKISVIQENEIFGRRKRVPKSVKTAKTSIIDSFVELNPGDYVVHINYGIGRFKGIDRIKTKKTERDYISIEYAGEESIFIPIEQVNLIQRYIGQEGRPPRMDKIGGKSWDKKKAKTRKSVEDLADRLIALYARREQAVGYAFPKDNDWQVEFEASFPYQETEDQLVCIDEVKTDMEKPKPMDRLICGDVGYGKTEIAMRAAFKAVIGGRQCAFLAPTTILAEQHYENFCERFKRFPVKIGMLSRFVAKKDQKKTLEALEKGELDLLIGTHRILSKDVQFKNIGLMMIDEEQRFGVKDKEKLKELKHSVDCLTLSATPIPRTLHMSMLKIRDMSVLKTPPYNRHPIETFIQEFEPDLVARAIRREVERGGQVFYLHNRVESLENIQLFLQDLLPDLYIEIAHGKMTSSQLEDKMHRFIHGGYQVLVSTTIIENGIDIPNVNTIIIDRADMYGISQLYQLRGRVGRSDKLAYAYLLYPEGRAISELAMKRLKIISDFTDLGSGFKIAMKDMEVRGAGNLLGSQQHGEIASVGFDMYLRLLSEAVAEKRGDEKEKEIEVYLELDYTGFIPDSYIIESTEKMEIYKKIAAVESDDELERLSSHLFDQYGPLPDEVHSLLSLAEIRIICKKLYILSLKERGGKIKVVFGRVALISVDKVMRLIRDSGGRVKLDPVNPECLLMDCGDIGLKEKSEFIRGRLSELL